MGDADSKVLKESVAPISDASIPSPVLMRGAGVVVAVSGELIPVKILIGLTRGRDLRGVRNAMLTDDGD